VIVPCAFVVRFYSRVRDESRPGHDFSRLLSRAAGLRNSPPGRETGLVEIKVHDLREFARDKHRSVDDRPIGGGEGMVLKPEPIFECIEKLNVAPREERVAGSAKQTVILLSAQGRRLDQALAQELAALERIVLICGRYEGVDERVSEHLADRNFRSGLRPQWRRVGRCRDRGQRRPADPGAVGNEASTKQESFTAQPGTESGGQAGRSSEFRRAYQGACSITRTNTRSGGVSRDGRSEVLVNGNHDEIRRWRRRTALEKTLRNRPDLLDPATHQ